MLRACCERMTDLRVPAGQVVVRQGEPGDATYFVVEGSVTVTMKTDDGTELNVGVLVAPHVVGLLQLLTGGLRTETATAAVDTLLWKVDRADFAWAAEQFPGGLAAIIAILRTRMRAAHARTVLASALGEAALAALGEHIDWRDLRRGELLYRQGERCDGLYVVVSGLMEVSRDEAGKSQLVGRYGRGVLIGEAEVFAGTDRRGTAVAVRDSALVRISRDVFRAIALQNAELLWRITERSFHRLLDGRADAEQSGGQLFAVVPLNAGIDGKDFCARLVTQLSAMGRTLWVSPERLAAAGVMDAALDIEDDHPRGCTFTPGSIPRPRAMTSWCSRLGRRRRPGPDARFASLTRCSSSRARTTRRNRGPRKRGSRRCARPRLRPGITWCCCVRAVTRPEARRGGSKVVRCTGTIMCEWAASRISAEWRG